MGTVVVSFDREDYGDAGTVDAEDLRPVFPESWRLLDDVQLMELADPQWAIDSILPDEGVAVIYGPSGACKTTLVAAVMGTRDGGRRRSGAL